MKNFLTNIGFWSGFLYLISFAGILFGPAGFCRNGLSPDHQTLYLTSKLVSFPVFSYTPFLLWGNLVLFFVYGFLINKYLKNNLKWIIAILLYSYLFYLGYVVFFPNCVI